MDLVTVFQKRPNQAACIAHLGQVRWGDEPHCNSERVARKSDGVRIVCWNCRNWNNEDDDTRIVPHERQEVLSARE